MAGATLPLGGLASAGHFQKVAEICRKGCKPRTGTLADAQDRRSTHVLCGWRHLADACTSAHVADWISVTRHALAIRFQPRRCWSLPGWCGGSTPTRCRRSRWWPMPAGRCLPTRRSCSSNWYARHVPKQVVFSALGVREGLLYELSQRGRTEKGRADRCSRGTQCLALPLTAPWSRS